VDSGNPVIKTGDIWGGLAAMLVSLPQSIAFGIVVFSALDPTLVSSGAIAGTIGAIAIGILAPLAGGTPRLISSPSAPSAAFLGSLIAEPWLKNLIKIDQPQSIAVIGLVVLFAGLLQILFSFLRAGRVIKFIPYPVVAGYLSSVGAIIFISQMPRLAGLSSSTTLLTALEAPLSWDLHAVLIGSVTMVFMYFSPRVTRHIPGPIVGLAGGLLAYLGLAIFFPEYRILEGNAIVIGKLQGSLSLSGMTDRFDSLRHLNLEVLRESAVAGITLAVILSIDTLKSCVIVDTITRTRSNSNRELFGQGLGNLAAAAFGGIAGSGTLGATLVNVSGGGATRFSGAFAGFFSLVALIALSPFIAWVPVPALAGILILVAVRMIDWRIFKLLRQKSTALDFLVVITVIVVALKFSLMAAALSGFVLSAMFFLREQMTGLIIRRKSYGNEISSKKSRLPQEEKVIHENGKRTILYELQGNLFFGNTDRLFTAVTADLDSPVQFMIFSMRRVQSVDYTAVHMFEQIESILKERQGRIFLTDLTYALSGESGDKYFAEVGLVKPGSHIAIFEESFNALEWVEDFILSEKKLYHSHLEKPLELQEIEIFSRMSPERISTLRSVIQEKSCPEGEKIFGTGSSGDEIFFIRRGIVRIMLPLDQQKMLHLVSFGRGDFFGDMSFVDFETRSADAVAETETDLFILSRSAFDRLTAADPELGAEFYSNLSRSLALRFRNTHMQLRALD